MTDEMPTTMSEMPSRKRARMPIAKSQPHEMASSMSSKWRTLRKTRRSKSRISVNERDMARMLSLRICLALPTAMTGPPVKRMRTDG